VGEAGASTGNLVDSFPACCSGILAGFPWVMMVGWLEVGIKKFYFFFFLSGPEKRIKNFRAGQALGAYVLSASPPLFFWRVFALVGTKHEEDFNYFFLHQTSGWRQDYRWD
jgi:hypothetical protein